MSALSSSGHHHVAMFHGLSRYIIELLGISELNLVLALQNTLYTLTCTAEIPLSTSDCT